MQNNMHNMYQYVTESNMQNMAKYDNIHSMQKVMQYANKYVQYAQYAECTICIICNLICKIMCKWYFNHMHSMQDMTVFTICKKRRCKIICW